MELWAIRGTTRNSYSFLIRNGHAVIIMYWLCGPAQRCNDYHDDVIKWKYFPRYWPFVWGIHRSLVNSHRKGLWRGALMISLICVWINGWVNNRKAGDLRRHRPHDDVTATDASFKLQTIIYLINYYHYNYFNRYHYKDKTVAILPYT